MPDSRARVSRLLAALLLLGPAGCAAPRPDAPAARPATGRTPAVLTDPHSHGNLAEIEPVHLSLDLDLDFDRHRITGVAEVAFRRRSATERLVLDTRDLEIDGVTDPSGRPLAHRLLPVDPDLGRALAIDLPAPAEPGGREAVVVRYRASPDAYAVQWLEPAQTAGGEHPFLFTQSQSIHARSWIPCVDSPGARVTYDAVVRVPPGLTAVMSAEPARSGDRPGVFRFRMPQSVPPYLIALAAGEIESRDLGPRVRVYAEPPLVDRAAHEFADTERMIDVVEGLYGPYTWGRYDLIVLPPSFPFGGMENPRLSFITPTVLAGDRSLTSLIAHELAHSWSGNLVTNATWNDFWINEGFTTYVERRVMEALYGRELAEMEAALGKRDLEEDLRALALTPELTRLRQDLAGRDPDETFSAVPYEKGYLFLRVLEEEVGRERFDAFLKGLFSRHAFSNLSTAQVEGEIRERLLGSDAARAERIRLREWLYASGLPENVPEIRSEGFERVAVAAERFGSGAAPLEIDTEGWRTTHWLEFLHRLPEPLSGDRMAVLDEVFGFTESRNSEIFFAWARHAVRNDYRPAFDVVAEFLTGMGRMKFLEPLYADLLARPETADFARAVYERARPGYHPLAVRDLDEIFERRSG